MNKKAILKKYTGKGGIISDTISEIPNTIGNAYNNVKNKVQSGITKGIVNFVGDTPAGKILKAGLASQKQGILKNAISEAKPKITAPGAAISGAAKAIPKPAKQMPSSLKKLPVMPKVKSPSSQFPKDSIVNKGLWRFQKK